MSVVQGRAPTGEFLPVYDRAEIVAELCERLREGVPLAEVCRQDGMPHFTKVYDWSEADQAIGLAIRRAREAGEHAIAARLRKVANGVEGYSSGDAQRDKLIIDTDFKLLAKWNPKVWGENTQLRHADANGEKIDNSQLVSELLSLMPGGAPLPDKRPVIEAQARVRNVTPGSKSVYRPRIAPQDDVEDLV